MNIKVQAERLREKVWYQGRNTDSTVFDFKYACKEDNTFQNGPGFYFTDLEHEARRYSGKNSGIIHL